MKTIYLVCVLFTATFVLHTEAKTPHKIGFDSTFRTIIIDTVKRTEQIIKIPILLKKIESDTIARYKVFDSKKGTGTIDDYEFTDQNIAFDPLGSKEQIVYLKIKKSITPNHSILIYIQDSSGKLVDIHVVTAIIKTTTLVNEFGKETGSTVYAIGGSVDFAKSSPSISGFHNELRSFYPKAQGIFGFEGSITGTLDFSRVENKGQYFKDLSSFTYIPSNNQLDSVKMVFDTGRVYYKTEILRTTFQFSSMISMDRLFNWNWDNLSLDLVVDLSFNYRRFVHQVDSVRDAGKVTSKFNANVGFELINLYLDIPKRGVSNEKPQNEYYLGVIAPMLRFSIKTFEFRLKAVLLGYSWVDSKYNGLYFHFPFFFSEKTSGLRVVGEIKAFDNTAPFFSINLTKQIPLEDLCKLITNGL